MLLIIILCLIISTSISSPVPDVYVVNVDKIPCKDGYQIVYETPMRQEIFYVNPTSTPRTVLDEHGVDYIGKTIGLNKGCLNKGNIDKSFADLGISDTCKMLEV